MKEISPGERLKEIRKRQGLDPHVLAEALSIPSSQYFQLEEFDDLYDCFDLNTLFKLCFLLKITPLELFGIWDELNQSETSDSKAFVTSLRLHITSSNLTVEAFGNGIGWNVVSILENPASVFELHVEAIRTICNQTYNISWTGLLMGLFREASQQRTFP